MTVPYYVDTRVSNGTTYVYWMASVAASGLESWPKPMEPVSPSASLATVVPPAPTGVTVTRLNDMVNVHWETIPGVERYYVKRAASLNGPFLTIDMYLCGHCPQFADTQHFGLDDDTTDYFAVSGTNYLGEGAPSPSVAYQSNTLPTFPVQTEPCSPA